MRKARRRGGILPIVAVFMIAAALLAGLVFDMSRAYAQKNEMQTAADAAALSGVLELLRDTTAVPTAANYYSGLNLVLHQSIPDANTDVICGTWSDPTSTFSASGHCGALQDAVHVVARDTARFTFPLLLGLASKQVAVNATAWAAFVDATSCVKPWAIAYSLLTRVLDPTNEDTLRVLTATDLERLRSLPRSELRFMLKLGAPPGEPGSFGALDIPNPNVTGQGANVYEANIATCNATRLGRDSVVWTESGNMVGPTVKGARALCNPLVGEECQSEPGKMGVQVIAPLWTPLGPQQGTYPVQIKGLVSFSLDSVTNNAEVIGHFIPGVAGGGSVSGTPSTIRTVILVQ